MAWLLLMIWLDLRVGHLHFWIWANTINYLLILKLPNPSIAQEHKEGTLVQGSGSSIKQYLIGGTCLSVAHTSLTSPCLTFNRMIAAWKWLFQKGHSIYKIVNLQRKKNYEFHFRSHVNLHQHLCPETVTECRVMGCGTLVKRKNMNAHLMEAATEHFALQSNEMIKLKQSIFNKVRNQKYNIQM